MFTGIIETVGTVTIIIPRGNYKLLRIKPGNMFNNIQMGESIAVDGCCLTVTEISLNDFVVEASQETLKLAITGQYQVGQIVNLERALLPTSRMGGHIVSGHIDCLGEIAKIDKVGNSIELSVKFPEEYETLLVDKGSIAINGISLTVNIVKNRIFTVNIIPFTQMETTINRYKIGQKINLEFDILGKYVAKMLSHENKARKKNNLSIDKFIESGW
ncbi:MAG: riboflavin synthase [Candidatus Zixiibacteriota bacterium]